MTASNVADLRTKCRRRARRTPEKMKAAEAAFKDSVDVWEGGTDTEFGSAA